MMNQVRILGNLLGVKRQGDSLPFVGNVCNRRKRFEGSHQNVELGLDDRRNASFRRAPRKRKSFPFRTQIVSLQTPRVQSGSSGKGLRSAQLHSLYRRCRWVLGSWGIKRRRSVSWERSAASAASSTSSSKSLHAPRQRLQGRGEKMENKDDLLIGFGGKTEGFFDLAGR